jgi:predicted DNA-binding WGR domain protein
MIHLTHKNQDAQSSQFYHLDIIPSLLGNWGVQREWGVIGSRGKHRVDWYDTQEEAQKAAEQLAESKINAWLRKYDIQPSRKAPNNTLKHGRKGLDAINGRTSLNNCKHYEFPILRMS